MLGRAALCAVIALSFAPPAYATCSTAKMKGRWNIEGSINFERFYNCDLTVADTGRITKAVCRDEFVSPGMLTPTMTGRITLDAKCHATMTLDVKYGQDLRTVTYRAWADAGVNNIFYVGPSFNDLGVEAMRVW